MSSWSESCRECELQDLPSLSLCWSTQAGTGRTLGLLMLSRGVYMRVARFSAAPRGLALNPENFVKHNLQMLDGVPSTWQASASAREARRTWMAALSLSTFLCARTGTAKLVIGFANARTRKKIIAQDQGLGQELRVLSLTSLTSLRLDSIQLA